MSSSPQGDGPIGAFSGLLMAMAALVLVVACLNLANLLLARGAARRREIAIRQALGSGRRRIVEQLLVEGLVLSLLGAACGVIVGWWATGALSAWLASALPLGIDVVVEPSWRMLPAAVGFAIFSTVAFALGPSWSLSRPTVAADLKEERGSERRRFVTGSLLVISQVAVSLALVAAGGLFVRAALRAAQADPGFSLENQLMVSLDPSMARFDRTQTKGLYRTALERVRSIPRVERASFASIVPFGEFREGRTIRLLPGTDGVGADFMIVGADYFTTVGLPLLRGREFTASEGDPGGDLTGVIPVVIDRVLSKRLFADADPLGRQLLIEAREGDQAKPFVVVGVAGTMKHDLFDTEARGHVFAPFAGVFRASMTLHIRTAPGTDATAMLGTVRRELRQVDERLPIVAARTMIEHRDRSLTEWGVRAAATIFSAFGLLALLLATIGVYGLKAYDVSRRTREIGIRMALGATAANVQRLVLREGIRTTVIGLVLGLLMAAGLGKLVSGLLYQVSPFDPIVLAAASGVLCAAAMLASYVPARRATRVVPLDALRSE